MQNLDNISGNHAPQAVEALLDRGSAAFEEAKAAVVANPAKLGVGVNKGWILNPFLDYLFVAGGLVWVMYAATLFGCSPVGNSPSSQIYAGILYWGSILINEAHGPATLMRVFGSKTTPNRVRYIVAAWGLILLAVSYAAIFNKPVTQIFVKVTFIWAVQHYIAQTFGIVLIYCFKRGHKLDGVERFVFQGLMRSLMYFIVIRMFTLPAYGRIDNFMGLEIPFWGPIPSVFMAISQIVCALFALAFVSLVVGRLIVKKQGFPLIGIVTIITMAAVTLTPRMASFYLLGVIFYHSSQYLAITFSYFLKEKALARTGQLPDNILPQFISKRALFYFAAVVAVGYLANFTLPVEMTKSAPANGTLILCTVFALFNCHHYLADALIWRIRDPKVKQLLV